MIERDVKHSCGHTHRQRVKESGCTIIDAVESLQIDGHKVPDGFWNRGLNDPTLAAMTKSHEPAPSVYGDYVEQYAMALARLEEPQPVTAEVAVVAPEAIDAERAFFFGK